MQRKYHASGRPATRLRPFASASQARMTAFELEALLPPKIAAALAKIGEGTIRDKFLWKLADAIDIVGPDITNNQMSRILLDVLTEPEEDPSEDQPSDGHEVVYYIQIDNGLVKIGHTKNLAHRVRTLYRRPQDILATEPGDHRLESMRHQQFAADRADWGNMREVFHLTEVLQSHIAMLQKIQAPAA